MIAFLKGILNSKTEGTCAVDVNGVGYEVHLPLSDVERLPPLGEAVTLYTWYLGREDGVQLFGFLAPESRALFKLLLGVRGIGPKSALAVLSGLTKPALEAAVARQDPLPLAALPGIGRKTAARLLLELKDKLDLPTAGSLANASLAQEDFSEALEALVALGYSATQARTALQKVADQALPPGPTGPSRVADLIRQALKRL